MTPSEIAWIAVLPVALAAVLSIAAIGPPLGRALLPVGAIEPWPSMLGAFAPEPEEHGRYLVSLLAPILLAVLTLVGARLAPQLRPSLTTALVTTAQAAAAAFVVVCLSEQRAFLYDAVYTGDPATAFHRTYFSLATYAVAAAATAAVVAAVRSAAVRERAAAWTRDTRARQLVAGGVAVVAIGVWLLHAFNTDATIAAADYAVAYHVPFTFNETFTVLNGRSPLVDFASQYGSLWPYPIAAVMAVAGKTLGVFSAMTLLLNGVAMLAIYALLRRVARSAAIGLLLFLPFLATSFFLVHGELANRYTFGTLTGTFPMRYAGPFLLAWLVARHLDGTRPRQLWLLFTAAGLVVMNNADAGLPALGATVAALLWAGGRPSGASLGRLAVGLVAGVLAAFALVSALTLLRTGSLPHLELLLRYSRLFGAAGFGMLPMPTLGLHIVIYLTFVAAIGVATVRAVTGDHDRTLTGLLAWSGIFGLGAGAYYVGRSHPESLVATFTTWSLTLALLMLVTVRGLAAHPRRRPSIAALMCIFGFAVAACSLAQAPLPWQQLERIERAGEPIYAPPPGQAFVAQGIEPDEHVLILFQLGHRIAANLGVVNVSLYTGSLSMPLREQLDEALAALAEEGGRKVFLPVAETPPEIGQTLQQRGFRLTAQDGVGQQWVRPGTG